MQLAIIIVIIIVISALGHFRKLLDNDSSRIERKDRKGEARKLISKHTGCPRNNDTLTIVHHININLSHV